MPNWCNNVVTLYHEDVSKLDALEEVLKKHTENANELTEADGVFQHLRPRPADQNENWYDWNVTNWGTKWDINPGDWWREEDGSISISFDSAWSPPISLYDYLDEEGWDVYANYDEPGMCFVGEYKDGEDFYYEYDFSDPNWQDEVPDHIKEYAGLDTAYEDWVEWSQEAYDPDEKEVD